jgi:hypothetical protein
MRKRLDMSEERERKSQQRGRNPGPITTWGKETLRATDMQGQLTRRGMVLPAREAEGDSSLEHLADRME